jgi:polyisoprenoid-binding protein YceI
MTTTTKLSELTGDYVLDTAHTRIGFVARAAVVTKVRGQFEEFEGSGHMDGDDPSKSSAQLAIQAKSIQTRNRMRDDHLRRHFLDMDNHPIITFTSTKVEQGKATINRKDWGVSWNAAVEGGGVFVSEKVTLEFDVAAIPQS